MKNKIIAIVLTVISLLIFSEGYLFLTTFLVPNIVWGVPFYGWFLLSALYFQKVFGKQFKMSQKIISIILNFFFLGVFLYGGFKFWKLNMGNILSVNQDVFQINLKNIWFWILYQSYLLLFFFSVFKLLITIDQK